MNQDLIIYVFLRRINVSESWESSSYKSFFLFSILFIILFFIISCTVSSEILLFLGFFGGYYISEVYFSKLGLSYIK